MTLESAVVKIENDDNAMNAVMADLDTMFDEISTANNDADDFVVVETEGYNGEYLAEAEEAAVEDDYANLDDLDDLISINAAGDGDEAEDEVAAEEPDDELADFDLNATGSEMSDETLREFDLIITKSEVYAAAEAVEMTTEKPEPRKAKVRAAGTSTRKPSVPRGNRNLDDIPSVHFVLSGDITTFSDEQRDAAKKDFIDNLPEPVKVQEKIQSIFASIVSGATLSPYISIPIKLLIQNKAITSADIVAAYMLHPTANGTMKTGTARSQCTQMMRLLPYLGLAERNGGDLKLKADSNLIHTLEKLL